MELFDIQNMVQRGEKPKFLVFVGSDYAVANNYINNLSEIFKLEKYGIESLSSLSSLCRGNEIFTSERLYVLKYPKDLSNYESVFENIDDILGENMLIIVLNDVDKRTKFYTKNKEVILDCSPQEYKTFKEMVRPITSMSQESVRELGEICGYNYGKFLSELDKVKNYSQVNSTSEDEALKILVSSGAIYTDNRDVIFEFIGRVIGAKQNMYEMYNVLRKNGESNIKILSLLYTAFRNQFICETVVTPNTESTGLAPFIINQCVARKGRYSQHELRTALKLLMNLEQGVKSGRFDEDSIIDYFLAELLL